MDELNYKFIRDFEKYIKNRTPDGHQKPCTQNGSMKHIERLRKMVNLAVKEDEKVLSVCTNQKTNSYFKEIAYLREIDKNLTYHLAQCIQ